MILAVIGWGLDTLQIHDSAERSLVKPNVPNRTMQSDVSDIARIDTGITFADFPRTLIKTGVIDIERYRAITPLSSAQETLLGSDTRTTPIYTGEDDQFTLNLLWGLGLAQENKYLGELATLQQEERLGVLASTGGWAIGTGDATVHFSKHNILNLSDEQQRRVADIAATIYRSCCNNHARFADCNHGMAMLGVLSLGVAQGLSDDALYTLALQFNRAWFPDIYEQIAQYFSRIEGKSWKDVNPREILGAHFSSASGFSQNVARPLAALKTQEPAAGSKGGSCSL